MFSASQPGSWESTLPVLLRGGSEETQSELSLRLTLTPSGAPSQPGRVRGRAQRAASPFLVRARRLLTRPACPLSRAAAASGGDERGGPVLLALAGAERGGLREPEGGAEHPGGLCNLPGQDCGPALARLLLCRRGTAPVRAALPSAAARAVLSLPRPPPQLSSRPARLLRRLRVLTLRRGDQPLQKPDPPHPAPAPRQRRGREAGPHPSRCLSGGGFERPAPSSPPFQRSLTLSYHSTWPRAWPS